MESVDDPAQAEWLGPQQAADEDERAQPTVPLPAGFLSATYRAGDERAILMRFDAEGLPETWTVDAVGLHKQTLVDHSHYAQAGRPAQLTVPWGPVAPPEKLVVRWQEFEALWPVNVDDAQKLPPPEKLEQMTADDMLLILAASDPSAAFRAWTKRQASEGTPGDDIDLAEPPDLDPLKRYSLQDTFLHRIRRRARILAQLRANLERPAWSRQVVEWRLRGSLGVQALSVRMVQELTRSGGDAAEDVLALADLLIMLNEVSYQDSDGAITHREFAQVFRPFLAELAESLDRTVREEVPGLSRDVSKFWTDVVERCRPT